MKIDNQNKKKKQKKIKAMLQAPGSNSEIKSESKNVKGENQSKNNKKIKKKKKIKNIKTPQALDSGSDTKHVSFTASATIKAPKVTSISASMPVMLPKSATTSVSEEYSALMENIRAALSKTRKHFVLGSSNILPIMQNKNSIYDDSLKVIQGLFSHKKKQSNVDALVDAKLSELVVQRGTQRMQKAIDFELALNLETTEGEGATGENLSKKEIDEKSQLHGVKLSQIYLSGNCGDMSLFLSHVLHHEFKINSVMYEFGQSGLDHAFLVVFENKPSDPTDVRSWNPKTIIIDSWLNLIFTPETFVKYWGENLSLITSPVSERFAPERISDVGIRTTCLREALKTPICLWKVTKYVDSSIFTKGHDTSGDKQSALEDLQKPLPL